MKHEIWRYTRTGRVKHALPYADARTALCGTGPDWFSDWCGTGSQSEYEKAAVLPPCKRCVAKGFRP